MVLIFRAQMDSAVVDGDIVEPVMFIAEPDVKTIVQEVHRLRVFHQA